MATEIATTTDQATAYLMPLLMSSSTEADIPDDTFRAIAAFAEAPPPEHPPASPDDVREIVAFLAGSMKAPRTGLEAGKLKLGAYRLALAGLSKPALEHGAKLAIRELEWLPAPAELLKLCNSYLMPERIAHARAVRLTRDRNARLLDATLRKCELKAFSPDELQALPEFIARIAETKGLILTRLSGERCYRTREAILADIQDRRKEIAALAPPPDERSNRAEEHGDPEKGSTFGALAAGIVKGMEAGDA